MAKSVSTQPKRKKGSGYFEQRPEGAYVELAELIAARFLAKDLKLQQRRKALSLLAGPNKTNFRGRGIDFEEIRAYQAGDDIRTIDWRVTARTSKPYTKLFQEERERPLLIVTDQRQPMFFGSQFCFKSVMACHISALLAWAGLQQGDRVGGLVFGNHQHREIKPRRSRQSALAFIHLLEEYNGLLTKDTGPEISNKKNLRDSLQEVRRIAKPGNTIYLVSDFSDFNDQDIQKQLFLLSRHNEIVAFYIYDPLEKQLPPPGQYMVTNGQERHIINTADRLSRKAYQRQFDQNQLFLQQQMRKLGIPLIDVATTDAPLKPLLHYYGAKHGVSHS